MLNLPGDFRASMVICGNEQFPARYKSSVYLVHCDCSGLVKSMPGQSMPMRRIAHGGQASAKAPDALNVQLLPQIQLLL
jgi:hypothetical protein